MARRVLLALGVLLVVVAGGAGVTYLAHFDGGDDRAASSSGTRTSGEARASAGAGTSGSTPARGATGRSGAGAASATGGSGAARPAGAARTLADLDPDRVIARVEGLRGLKLLHRPRFRVLTPRQARRQVAASEERESGDGGSQAEEGADVAVSTLLGLLPPDTDLDELSGRVTSEGTLGYYDGDRNEMTIISKGPTLPVGVETTVAHELTHAIDEQHFHVFARAARITDEDAALAYRSVLEGDASDVEDRYAKRYRIPQPDPAGDAAAKRLVHDLPYGLVLQLGFPYSLGQSFVEALRARPDGEALVARALRSRPPRSTVEILDPARYLAGARPTVVRLNARRVLGVGWRARESDDIGAVDVLALLSPTQGDTALAGPIAQAWRGGSFRYLRRTTPRGACHAPCVRRDAVVGSVVFASAGSAQAFTERFGQLLEERRSGRAISDGVWRVGGGGAAAGTDGATATFAYAPTTGLARRLVREAPEG